MDATDLLGRRAPRVAALISEHQEGRPDSLEDAYKQLGHLALQIERELTERDRVRVGRLQQVVGEVLEYDNNLSERSATMLKAALAGEPSNVARPTDPTDDEVMAMSDEEVRAQAAAEGVDIEAFAERMRAVIKAHARAWAHSRNYIADREIDPTKVTFANGRTVEVVNEHLVVGLEASK